VSQQLVELVLRMACENPRRGYNRIVGAASNLGFSVSASTVRNILKRHGIDPAPERGKRTTWGAFLKTHWELLAATDFFTVEVWTPRGLVTYYLLFAMHLATRRVYVAEITTNPNGAFMTQVARHLTDAFDGPLRSCRYLIMDRDHKFSPHFKASLRRESIEPVLCPPRAPNCNAYAERLVHSVKEECLARIIPIELESVRRAVSEFLVHYHAERNHQGLENRLIEPPSCLGTRNRSVRRRKRLGGMLSYYYQLAA
jgi:transposase InsO family protein